MIYIVAFTYEDIRERRQRSGSYECDVPTKEAAYAEASQRLVKELKDEDAMSRQQAQVALETFDVTNIHGPYTKPIIGGF